MNQPNQERYIPPKQEFDNAESMMTDEQHKDSEIRAKNWEQEQSPWETFEDENIDANFERKLATSEQIERMDKSLKELGHVFEGSNLNWRLDGALNISLMNGKYIGNHKDVDISVEKEELAELENQLLKNGYGLKIKKKIK